MIMKKKEMTNVKRERKEKICCRGIDKKKQTEEI